MQRSESGTALTLVIAWIAQHWNDYLEPVFQALLVILTVIAAFYMVWNRILENRIKRNQLRKYEQETILRD